MESRSSVECFLDVATLTRAAADRVVACARAAIAARGRFLFVLSGGSTPRSLYELLAADPYATQIDWSRVHVFWSDERCVPPDSDESNYRMARETLLDRVTLPPGNIHRIRGEDDPEAAASSYDELLHHVIGRDSTQTFDLVLLGMGLDGHTASLFPGTAAVREMRRWVVATRGPEPDSWRVTLTLPALNAGADVMFLVTGAEKAEPLKQVLEGSPVEPLPAQWIRPERGVLYWMFDAAAATRLSLPRA